MENESPLCHSVGIYRCLQHDGGELKMENESPLCHSAGIYRCLQHDGGEWRMKKGILINMTGFDNAGSIYVMQQ